MIELGLTRGDCAPMAPTLVVPIRRKRLSPKQWRRLSNGVLDGQGGQCLICGETGNFTCHHVIPLHRGGVDTRENLIGLCGTCHTTLHLLERGVSLRSRLLIAAMAVFYPTPGFCKFLRLAFPLLIRRGIGFHPASLRLRPLRVRINQPQPDQTIETPAKLVAVSEGRAA
jgi:hypothetical protein